VCFRGPLVTSILQQLPASSLTSLVITDADCDPTGNWRKAAHVRRSLQHLTSLRRLTLLEEEGTNTNILIAAVAGMQQLTYLNAGITRGMQDELLHLPPSLRELHMSAYSGRRDAYDEEIEKIVGTLQLGHLTALTKLVMVREVSEEVRVGDVLPQNLVEMHVSQAASATPLLHLQQLRVLTMGLAPDMPAAELQRLASGLSALQEVHLEYAHDTVGAAAAGWSCLPVRSLKLWSNATVSAAAMQHVSMLTGLTRLEAGYGGVHYGATLPQFGEALLPLVQLQELSIDGRCFTSGEEDDDIVDTGAGAVLHAVAGMQCLRRLKLNSILCTSEAITELAAVPHLKALTQLQMTNCRLDDYAVTVLALQLTALQKLGIGFNFDVGDIVMPVIAHSLTQLSSLQLWHTCVSSLGVRWLTGLQQLKEVGICSRTAGVAATAELRQSGRLIECREHHDSSYIQADG
jgi:hypothetical protein